VHYAECLYAECRFTLSVVASCGELGICFIEAKFIENQRQKTAGVWAGIHIATYKILTKFLQNFYKILTKFLQNSHKILTKFLQNSYKILTKFLQNSYKILTKFLQNSYDLYLVGCTITQHYLKSML
jgi:hypothetical protein